MVLALDKGSYLCCDRTYRYDISVPLIRDQIAIAGVEKVQH
jgi:hypothetical protein